MTSWSEPRHTTDEEREEMARVAKQRLEAMRATNADERRKQKKNKRKPPTATERCASPRPSTAAPTAAPTSAIPGSETATSYTGGRPTPTPDTHPRTRHPHHTGHRTRHHPRHHPTQGLAMKTIKVEAELQARDTQARRWIRLSCPACGRQVDVRGAATSARCTRHEPPVPMERSTR